MVEMITSADVTALPLEPKNRLPCFGVSPRLHQDVEHIAMLVDRTPQVLSGAVDLHEHLVKVPFVAGTGSPTT
jgi:hypothetical protein